MIIDLSQIDETQFKKKEGIFGGREAVLVNPDGFNAAWTQDNSIFRSSVWSKSGELLSPGLKKFVNWSERPEHFPVPLSLKNTSMLSKLDGFCLIISKVDDNVCARTRGTFDFRQLETGWELDVLKDKYPKAFENTLLDDGFTLIFEAVSDVNKIILSYDDCPDMFLLNIIDSHDYSYMTQTMVDNIAVSYNLKRPERRTFKNIDEMLEIIPNEEDIEGYCLYYGRDQIVKLKTLKYLRLHRMKSDLASLEKIVDIFIDFGCPNYLEFYNKIEEQFDFELAEYCKGNLSKICDAYKEVKLIEVGMKTFCERLSGLTRKEQALKIISSYGTTNRASFCFSLLDYEGLDNKAIKKLTMQMLFK
jgi:hypothetical protein